MKYLFVWTHRIAVCMVFCFTAVVMFAVPARRGWQTRTQADGSTIEVQVIGDEFYHYIINRDGKQVREVNGIFEVVGEAPTATAVRARHAQSKQRRQRKEIGTKPNLAEKGLVILVNFSDKSMQSGHTKAVFDELFNSTDCTVNSGYPSAAQYFADQSDGAYRPQFDVFGPVTLSRNVSYYGKDKSEDGDDQYATDAIVEACIVANEQYDINWADYDSDNDGYVDFVYVIYAGKGQADGGSSETIWPHNWDVTSAIESGYCTYTNAQRTVGGKKINNYACSSELTGNELSGIGTLCHEFGHVMGLPDLYDTQYGTNYSNCLTPNDWNIMDGGSYNADGHCPPNYDPWEKEFFGWHTTINLGAEGKNVTLYANGNEKYQAYQINTSGSYVSPTTSGVRYYIENRQAQGWDAPLTGHGMLIWKVNFNDSKWTNNEPNNTANNPYYTIVSATGTKIGRDGSTDNCPKNTFPGSGKVTSYTGISGKPLLDIAENNGIITLTYIEDTGSTPELVVNNCATAAQAALSVSKNNELYNNGEVFTIQGYVTEIVSEYNSAYKNISFWMADTPTGGKVLEVFRAACESEKDAVHVGDLVEVTGTLSKYNFTPEFTSGCTYSILESSYISLPTVALSGNFNEWSTTTHLFEASEDQKSASLAITLEQDTYEFKIVSGGNWLSQCGESDLFLISRDAPTGHTDEINYYGCNYKLAADVSGDYIFTWTYADSTITITFPKKEEPVNHFISVDSNNPSWGTVSGGGSFGHGAEATLTAVASEGYDFEQWSDGNTDNPRTVIVTSDSVFTAIFKQKPQPVAKRTIHLNVKEWRGYSYEFYFFAFAWKSDGAPKAFQMISETEFIYKTDIEADYTDIVFACIDPDHISSPSLENATEKTENLTLSSDKDIFTVNIPVTSCADALGEWSVYDSDKYAIYYDYGSCTDDMTFTVSREGVLAFSGYGYINNYFSSDESCGGWAPWECWSSLINTISLPEGLTSIGTYTFNKCKVSSITIPSTVTSISDNAFNAQLTSITCKATTPPTIYSNTFKGVDRTIPVYVPAESVEAYKAAEYWKDFTGIQTKTEKTIIIVKFPAEDRPSSIEIAGTFEAGIWGMSVYNEPWWMSDEDLYTTEEDVFKFRDPDNEEFILCKYNEDEDKWEQAIFKFSDLWMSDSWKGDPCMMIELDLSDAEKYAWKEGMPEPDSKPTTRTLYLDAGVWTMDNAQLYIYVWTKNFAETEAIKMSHVEDNLYKADIDVKYISAIFARLNSEATAFDWDAIWNNTAGLDIPDDKDMYVITDWNDGYWAVYGEQPQPVSYFISVESNNPSWGTVSGGGSFGYGAEATLTAIPGEDYDFEQWSDGNTDNPRTVIVTSDSLFTAIFKEKIPQGTRAIYLNTTEVWGNDFDFYIYAWQNEAYPSVIRIERLKDYLFRAYINEEFTNAYFIRLSQGETFTSIDDIFYGEMTKTVIPSDKDLYTITCGYMGVWSLVEYGEWSVYDETRFAECYGYGICGENLEYAVSHDNTLVISGFGDMDHYATAYNDENPRWEWAPWRPWEGHIRSVSLPEGLTTIGAFAFELCYNITDITIPSTVNNIGSGAFNAEKFTSVTCKATTPPAFVLSSLISKEKHIFQNADFSIPLYVPAESVEAYKAADYWKDFTNIQPIGGSIDPVVDTISVAQALELAQSIEEYMTGEVLYNIVGYATAYSDSEDGGWSTYGNQTFWIADTKDSNAQSNAEGAFYVYRGIAPEKVEIGDKICVTSRLHNYRGIIETESRVPVTILEKYNGETPVDPVSDADVIFDVNDFAGKGVAGTGGEVIVTKNGVHFYCDKGYGDGTYGVRCYKGSRVTISSDSILGKNITKIAFEFAYINGEKKNGGLPDQIEVNAAQWETTLDSAQARMNKIYVYLEKEAAYYTVNVYPNYENWGYVSGSGTYVNGAQVTLTATPYEGYEFVNWSDGVTEATRVITVTRNIDLTAVFKEIGQETPNYYSVTLYPNNENWGFVSGSGTYEENVMATLTATPYDGYEFVKWSDDITYNPRYMQVTRNITLTAIFQEKQTTDTTTVYYTMTVTANSDRLGYVMGSGSYVEWSTAAIEAVPYNGARFVKWSDGETFNPRYVTMNSDMSYTAIFKATASDATDLTNIERGTYDTSASVIWPWPENANIQPWPVSMGTESIQTTDGAGIKVLVDGMLYIIRPDGSVYDARGQRIK